MQTPSSSDFFHQWLDADERASEASSRLFDAELLLLRGVRQPAIDRLRQESDRLGLVSDELFTLMMQATRRAR